MHHEVCQNVLNQTIIRIRIQILVFLTLRSWDWTRPKQVKSMEFHVSGRNPEFLGYLFLLPLYISRELDWKQGN